MEKTGNFQKKLRKAVIGEARDLSQSSTFGKISLIAFFAWVGLGADPLSSSCYGPEEIYRNLNGHTNLAFIVALITILTIFIISTSYSQIIRLFPQGGGGYLVATKLLSPQAGMVSGSALLIDYVLTITISISSGADAIFSFLPKDFLDFKITFILLVLGILILLNLRGVRESVITLAPIFLIFVITHLFLIIYAGSIHFSKIQYLAGNTQIELKNTIAETGLLGTIFLILKSYSLGAGTYTGIEAVSNGIPNLREPRVPTALKTMRYLSISLAIAVLGLIISYYLFDIKFMEGKTLNASLVYGISNSWNPVVAKVFTMITLISEGALLFVAAQAGFIDGPRVMANMAHDYWFPRRFISVSDRLVSQNGILLMGTASFVMVIISKGSVAFLVILYSINVFITFSLSQLGMVKHWIDERKTDKKWFFKFIVNGIGLTLTTIILFTVIILKFKEGGWLTILITGVLVVTAMLIKIHYLRISREINTIQKAINKNLQTIIGSLKQKIHPDRNRDDLPTAVFLMNGYSGIGVYSLIRQLWSFGNSYRNLVFLQIGNVNTHIIRSPEQVEQFQKKIESDLTKYVYLANQLGLESEYYYTIGTDICEEIEKILPRIREKFPNCTFMGGQIVFHKTFLSNRILHNFTLFSIQRMLYKHGISTLMIPIIIDEPELLITKLINHEI